MSHLLAANLSTRARTIAAPPSVIKICFFITLQTNPLIAFAWPRTIADPVKSKSSSLSIFDRISEIVRGLNSSKTTDNA